MEWSAVMAQVWWVIARRLQRWPAWLRTPLLAVTVLLLVILSVVLAIPLAVGRLGLAVWQRLFPPPPQRRVVRLDDHQSEVDVVVETINADGQTLRKNGRRRILRDPRLLPKAKLHPLPFRSRHRQKLFQVEEANRLFAGTLRTRNRHQRDLLLDEVQLENLGLPVWKSEADIAQALGITVGMLRHYSIHRDAETVRHYVQFAIAKRHGGQRILLAPKTRLKQIQRQLLALLLCQLPVSPYANGFKKGCSVVDAASPHVGKKWVLKVDIKDFFPSLTFARVRGLLIGFGYSYPIATTLAVLMTEAVRQPVVLGDKTVFVPVSPRHCPQGAPTSPALSNALCRRLDYRLAGLAKACGWSFTRYADDLTFSGNDDEPWTQPCHLIKKICQEEGFTLNASKTRLLRQGRRQTVTGVVVNKTLGLSRQERRRLRAVAHRLTNPQGPPATLDAAQFAGKLAYLRMLNPLQAEAVALRWQRL